jgi:hypothetical protein
MASKGEIIVLAPGRNIIRDYRSSYAGGIFDPGPNSGASRKIVRGVMGKMDRGED